MSKVMDRLDELKGQVSGGPLLTVHGLTILMLAEQVERVADALEKPARYPGCSTWTSRPFEDPHGKDAE